LAAFSAGASSSSKTGKEALLGLVISQFRASDTRMTYIPVGTGTLLWAKGESELIICLFIYSFIHSFFFCRAGTLAAVAMDLWAGNGILW
jgi:hypothetical protein